MLKRPSECAETPTESPEQWIRKLDLDDIYLLSYFYDNIKAASVATILRLSASAITSRSIRISAALGFKVFQRVRGRSVLTDSGRKLAKAAKSCLEVLSKFSPSDIDISARMIAGALRDPTRKPRVAKIKEDDENFGETDDCGYLGQKV